MRIKFNDTELKNIKNEIEKKISEIDTEAFSYGIYVEVESVTIFFQIDNDENGLTCTNSFDFYVFEKYDCRNNGFYAEEIGRVEKNQAKELLNKIQEELDKKNNALSIHTVEDIKTEYDEMLLALDDLDEYVKAMKELVSNSKIGLPIISLANDAADILKDIETITLEEIAASEV